MNILSQNIKVVLKNKIKNEIININEQLVDSLVDSLSNPSSNNKYFELVSRIQEKQLDLIKSIIINTLETYDLEFKNSYLRKKYYHISKSNIPRTITTIFGDITYKRTYFKSIINDKYHFLLDEELGLEKYDRYDHIVKGLAINLSFDTNQKKSGEILGKQFTNIKDLLIDDSIKNIPRQSIYNWIKNWCIPNFNYPEVNTPNTLFIMADEKFIGCQNNPNDIMVKTFVTFEGVKEISKNRKKLINRHVFSTKEKQAWPLFVDELYRIYNPDKLEHIYIMSDGGKWIKAGIDELRVNSKQELTRLLCQFHLKQAINRMTTDKDYREIINLSFSNDNKKDLINLINGLILLTPNKKDSIIKNRDYISNNYTAMKAMANFNIGSSMESHISHCIASFFASRPKGYSTETINKYLKLNDYKNNNINILNLYLKTYNSTEVIDLNNNDLNWNIFESPQESNIPNKLLRDFVIHNFSQ